jgi:hypothetical protein
VTVRLRQEKSTRGLGALTRAIRSTSNDDSGSRRLATERSFLLDASDVLSFSGGLTIRLRRSDWVEARIPRSRASVGLTGGVSVEARRSPLPTKFRFSTPENPATTYR